jgi:dienelactone hydrolase
MMNKRLSIIIISVINILSACQSAPTNVPAIPSPLPESTESIIHTDVPIQTAAPTSTETGVPTEEPLVEVTPTFIEEPEGEITSMQENLESPDGLVLVGTFYAPDDVEPPWPGVILLHMLWSDRSVWDGYAHELAGNGFAVFALDMRGHGETGGEVNWDLAGEDIQFVWDTLSSKPNIDPGRMGIVGASIGANLALIGGTNEPETQTVVLLSPGLSYAGVETSDAMVMYGERPVFIVASQEDNYAASSSEKLHDLAIGESRLEIYQDAGHGTFMLENQPELGREIIDWLQEHLQ